MQDFLKFLSQDPAGSFALIVCGVIGFGFIGAVLWELVTAKASYKCRKCGVVTMKSRLTEIHYDGQLVCPACCGEVKLHHLFSGQHEQVS